MSLKDTALLVHFKRNMWTNRASSKDARNAVAERFDVNTSHDRYIRSILPHEEFKEINRIGGAAYRYHINQTLPWLDGGLRLLPSKNFLEYAEKMNGLKAELQAAVQKLCARLDELKARAAAEGGALYNDRLVPSCEALLDSFAINVTFLPFPEAQDFRLEDAERDRVAAELAERHAEAMRRNDDELWGMIEMYARLLVNGLATVQRIKRPQHLLDMLRMYHHMLPDGRRHARVKEMMQLLSGRSVPMLRRDGIGPQIAQLIEEA